MNRGSSHLIHWAGDLLLTILALCLSVPIRWLPPRVLPSMSRWVGSALFFLHPRYRKRVVHNLRLAFGGEMDPKGIEKLAREVFFHLTLTPLESLYGYLHPPERFLLKIKIEGEDHLRSALAEGRGTIALGLHLGPFTLVGARLALEGYRFNLIYNEGNYPKFWKRLGKHQRRLGQNPIPLKPISVSLKKALNCLRRNEILYLIADEQQRRGGVPTPFFGRTAFTPPGPALLSLKTGAPILPMFIRREQGVPEALVIGPPITVERSGNLESDMEQLTIAFTKAVERVVRAYPSQWAWLNRRWKQPKGSLTVRGET
ncbi:MAG: lysophospholipid acyltransferase family protein [Desulfobacterota bacterium]|nr:lysophospholipid acyltransferase family protein [Thermodesulfobacteriota bacterium]